MLSADGTPEQRLPDRFKKSGRVQGRFRFNVWTRDGQQIDLVVEGYARLFRNAHPEVKRAQRHRLQKI